MTDVDRGADVRPRRSGLKSRSKLEVAAFSWATASPLNSAQRWSFTQSKCNEAHQVIGSTLTFGGKRVIARMCNATHECVRCGKTFVKSENRAGSCLFHGDILGNVMELTMYEDHHFDDAALDNVKGPRYGRRWACCQDTDADAPPCKSGYHVTYDCGAARWAEGIQFAVK